MAPPRNVRRRDTLAGAAIEILAAGGIHKLSHRAVDEHAGVPAGTASNYFASRDELLVAAARRVAELHLADMAAASGKLTGPISTDVLAALIGASLYESATRYRSRYLAIYELTLEATRNLPLAQALSQIAPAALERTVALHRELGLATSPEQAQLLITLFGGALLTLITGPPGAVTREAALTLARCLVTGILGAAGQEARPVP
jgi:DNA-binding transcriptional regulator YbjK